MSDTPTPESSGPKTKPETSDTPISGSVEDVDFISDGYLLLEVEDTDGDLWYETYEFNAAERADAIRQTENEPNA